MIKFGTGGWRAVIGEDFTRANIERVAAALARRMVRENCADKGICVGYDRRLPELPDAADHVYRQAHGPSLRRHDHRQP